MEGFIDLHTHILPGLDDGARNIEESKEMLRQAWKEGIREIIATPHFFGALKSASKEKIEESIFAVEMLKHLLINFIAYVFFVHHYNILHAICSMLFFIMITYLCN